MSGLSGFWKTPLLTCFALRGWGPLFHKGDIALALSVYPSETLPTGSPDASALLWTPRDMRLVVQMCGLLKCGFSPASLLLTIL